MVQEIRLNQWLAAPEAEKETDRLTGRGKEWAESEADRQTSSSINKNRFCKCKILFFVIIVQRTLHEYYKNIAVH